MSLYTVFTTPGELDLSALTVFGLHAKPNTTNPIGFFGSGLKCAIAVLLRHKIPITIYTGGQEYKFYTKDKNFRNEEFLQCRYRKSGLLNKFTYHDLPFTTEFCKHWELWAAFREIMSNTLDENGTLGVVDNYLVPTSGYTQIVIEGQAFADIATNEKDDIFLPKDKLKLVAANNEVEVYEGNSRYIYYRGLRAYDLKEWEKQSIYTYNYIGRQAELTEDRTIKHVFYVRDAIAQLICKSDDRKFIGTVMKPSDRFWEKGFDYAQYYTKSDTFNSVVYRMGSSPANAYMPSSARTYYSDVLRDAPKVAKGLEISDKIWEAITEELNELDKQSKDFSDWGNAIEAVRDALENLFNRKPPELEVVMVPRDSNGDDIPF